ncbi:hypothetical protein [Alloalcanivorax xenomutans]|uniref:hypothetical protein n=1 Tax=Alloalcanivorax xenomutans TaxID=1094342 RepID=UPI001F3F03C0|nr:hypothetical protein [Alloalcanivorax xenomutans]MCE7521943.1 hypothetical protein [Alloalcanivorax xenomutans]
MIYPNPDLTTAVGRAEHVINTLCRIEQTLPLGECNGRWQQSLADAVALQGKPVEDYTVGELLSLAEAHGKQWLESEHYRQAMAQHRIDTGGEEYTQ